MKKAYGFVVLTAFLFGTMEVACKVAGNQLDPFQLTFIRFAIGGLILLPFATVELRKAKIRLTARDLLRLAGVGILGISLSMVFFQLGVSNSNASTASVLISINPLFTMVFAHFFTSEKLNRHKFVVLGFGLMGLIFMIRPWDVQEGNTVIGIVYMLLAAIFFWRLYHCGQGQCTEAGYHGADKHQLYTGIHRAAHYDADHGKTGHSRSSGQPSACSVHQFVCNRTGILQLLYGYQMLRCGDRIAGVFPEAGYRAGDGCDLFARDDPMEYIHWHRTDFSRILSEYLVSEA